MEGYVMEKLNLIQSLRHELVKLDEQKEINVEKLKELDKLYENNDDQLKTLYGELYCLKEEFYDKKVKKYMLFTGPVGVICAVIIYFTCNYYLIPTGKFDYISSLFISIFGSAIFSILSSNILAKKKEI